jgi:hypothetical protein
MKRAEARCRWDLPQKKVETNRATDLIQEWLRKLEAVSAF